MPDLPLEETVGIREACVKHGIELVLLATPTTPLSRMKDIALASQGFVYLVSVTGARAARRCCSPHRRARLWRERECAVPPPARSSSQPLAPSLPRTLLPLSQA